MQESMTEDMSFRQRLDAVLRTRDVEQVSDFLIAEGQWQPGTPVDAELAMWNGTERVKLPKARCMDYPHRGSP
jgi:hypothetical protein